MRRFAELSFESPALRDARREPFEKLALDIALYQRDHMEGLVRLHPEPPRSLEEIPAVHAEAFRLTRVATHPEELDIAVFRTSGTTQNESGRHPTRTLVTYEKLALLLAERTLFSSIADKAVVVALAPFPGNPPTSSLGTMMRLFMERWDGRKLTVDPTGSAFDVADPSRWLATPGIDVDGLVRACKVARARSEPLVVLATSFALAALIEALDGEPLPTPTRTTVMLTGGFKGRVAEIRGDELRRKVAALFRTPEENLVGEYGMTELTSQLYDSPGAPGVYAPPPWLRVIPVDPETGAATPRGTPGLARFVDLGNIDSSVIVQTEDLVVETDRGFELLGRRTGSTVRGCSLPFEGLLRGGAR